MAVAAARSLVLLVLLVLLTPRTHSSSSSGRHPAHTASTSAATPPCSHCPADWAKLSFAGVAPRRNRSGSLCGIVDVCASEVAMCDWSQPPDEVFASCKNLTDEQSPQPQVSSRGS